jgi:hypothetical protein
MTADEIVKELKRRGYHVMPREGLTNSYMAPESPRIPLLRSTRLQHPAIGGNAAGRVGSVYVHAPTPGAVRQFKTDGVIVATGGHRDHLLSKAVPKTGDMVRYGNAAWRGQAVRALLDKV